MENENERVWRLTTKEERKERYEAMMAAGIAFTIASKPEDMRWYEARRKELIKPIVFYDYDMIDAALYDANTKWFGGDFRLFDLRDYEAFKDTIMKNGSEPLIPKWLKDVKPERDERIKKRYQSGKMREGYYPIHDWIDDDTEEK